MAKPVAKVKLPALPPGGDEWRTRDDVHHLAQAAMIKKDPARLNAVKMHIKTLTKAVGIGQKKKSR